MSPSEPDPFERLAAECGLAMDAEVLAAVPDALARPPGEPDRYLVVTLRRADCSPEGVRLVFAAARNDAAAPSLREVLRSVAGDVWVVEQVRGDRARWGRIHGYAADDDAVTPLFDAQVRQASALRRLLGVHHYRGLLGAYAEIAASADGSSAAPKVAE